MNVFFEIINLNFQFDSEKLVNNNIKLIFISF